MKFLILWLLIAGSLLFGQTIVLSDEFVNPGEIRSKEPGLNFTGEGWNPISTALVANGAVMADPDLPFSLAAVSLTPTGYHETKTLSVVLRPPAGAPLRRAWVGFGFGKEPGFLRQQDRSIWVKVFANGDGIFHLGGQRQWFRLPFEGRAIQLQLEIDLYSYSCGLRADGEAVVTAPLPKGYNVRDPQQLVMQFNQRSANHLLIDEVQVEELQRPRPHNPAGLRGPVIEVRPSGGNDLQALQAVLDSLPDGGTLRLQEGGQYRIFGGSGNHLLALTGARNIHLEGRGASFLVEEASRGLLEMYDCRNVLISDLQIDYDPLPYSVSTIVAKGDDPNVLFVQADEGYETPDLGRFTGPLTDRWAYVIDQDQPGKLADGSFWNYTLVAEPVEVGNGIYEIAIDYRTDHLRIGDKFVRLARNSNAPHFYCFDSFQVTYRNVQTYAGPSGSFNSIFSEMVNLLDCRVSIKPGRWLSTNADCVHMQSQRIGPWIEGCLFEGQADDAINIYTRFYLVEQGSGREVILGEGGLPPGSHQMREWDLIDFVDPVSGILLETAEVASYDGGSGRLTLKSPLMTPPQNLRKCYAYNRNYSASFYIRNNQFRDSRRWGAFLKGVSGALENNTFERLSHAAVTIHSEPDIWGEGYASSDLNITRNVMIDCGFDGIYEEDLADAEKEAFAASLAIFMEDGEGGLVPNLRAHRDIFVVGNEIRGWNGASIAISNAETVVFQGNELEGGGVRLNPDSTSDVLDAP